MIIRRKTLEKVLVLLFLAVVVFSAVKIKSVPTDGTADKCYEVPVIMYHAVMQDTTRSGKYVITPETLENDIKYILDKGYTPVFMTDIINFATGDGELPEKPIVLTFDDGYYNNYLYAHPILKEYDVKAVISIIGKYTQIASDGERQSASYSHVSWSQLKEMVESGMWEVQNHTFDMHNTGDKNGILEVKGDTIDERNNKIREDIEKLQNLIYENTGVTPNTFTYPFGSFDESAEKLITDLGFKSTLSCAEGINSIYKGCNLDLLYRYNRDYGKSSAEFFESILN